MMNDKIVEVATACIGTQEGTERHKTIIDIYNMYIEGKGLYKMTMKDPWCAAFVSAVFIAAGFPEVIPVECSCMRMKTDALKRNILYDKARYVPKPGDVIFYKFNNSKVVNHTGIVSKVNGSSLEVIEGNHKDSVSVRKIKLSYKYIDSYIKVG